MLGGWHSGSLELQLQGCIQSGAALSLLGDGSALSLAEPGSCFIPCLEPCFSLSVYLLMTSCGVVSLYLWSRLSFSQVL